MSSKGGGNGVQDTDHPHHLAVSCRDKYPADIRIFHDGIETPFLRLAVRDEFSLLGEELSQKFAQRRDVCADRGPEFHSSPPG